MAKGAPAPDGAPTRPAQGGTQTIPVPAALDPARALILTANIAMRAQDPWAVADRAQAVAVSLGGDVVGLSQSGTAEQRTASLTLRVPSDRFNDALRQLRDLREVEVVSSNVESKDVTDQFVDLEARLRAKHAEEQRYIALLARADKIEDILRIDQALASVRTQIEQLTGQVNSIKSRTQFSTIGVSVTPLATTIPPAGVYDPAKTAERALAALLATFRVVADAAIWVLVFGWIPLLGLIAALALSRVRRSPAVA
ncbi:DUF4349 domain-containing protein [soil metagenome]